LELRGIFAALASTFFFAGPVIRLRWSKNIGFGSEISATAHSLVMAQNALSKSLGFRISGD